MRWFYSSTLALVPVGLAFLLSAAGPPSPSETPLPPPTLSSYRIINAGTTHLYALHLEAGQCARIVLDQRDIDLRLAASGPGLELPAINGSEWGREAVTIVAKTSGAYRVEVIAGTDDSAQGRYRIALAKLRPAQPADEADVQAQLAFTQSNGISTNDAAGRRAKERLLERAISGWNAAGDRFHEAQALNRAGYLFHLWGRYMDAQHSFDEALALWNQIGDPVGRLETLKLLANLGGYFGQERAPRPVLLEWLQAWQRIGDRRGEAMIFGSLGTYSRGIRDYDQAISYESRALRVREELGNRREIAGSLGTLAGYYADIGRFDQALACADRALHVARSGLKSHDVAAALSRMGNILEDTGQWEKAAPYLMESLALRQAEGDLKSQAQMNQAIAVAEMHRGNARAALVRMRAALEIEDGLAKDIARPLWKWAFSGWTPARLRYIAQLVELHWKEPAAGYGSQAFLEADRARGRFVERAKPAELPDLERMLDANTVLLEYWTEGNKGAVWVLTRTDFKVLPLLDVDTIHTLAPEAFALLSAPGSPEAASQCRTVMRQLSHLLLGPVASELDADRLLIVSDESFAFLPFAPLPDPNRSDGAPLIAHHEIVHLVSASGELSAQTRRRVPPGRLMAVVADPVFDSRDPRARGTASALSTLVQPDLIRATRSIGWTRASPSLPRLPYARQEARALAALAPSQVTPFLDFAASRQTVLANLDRYRILHFATHGLLNSDEPELSGLVLSLVDAQGRPRNGFLRLTDIYPLHTSADLVTLAACQTAAGHPTQVHGIIGLTGAFLHAGAARVLSTAWKVDDEATADLMVEFYRGLLIEHLSPAAALRKAQLAVAASERWRSPYYWAGAFLYGDWRTMWTTK